MMEWDSRDVKEYTDAAKALAQRQTMSLSKVGNIIFKYAKDTQRILIVNAKDRLSTFYQAGNGLQSFKEAMQSILKCCREEFHVS